MRLPHDLNPEGPDLTVERLAKCLDVSERTVYRWLSRGDFPHKWRTGDKGPWHIPQADVLSFIRLNPTP
jgi:excisionase family DNA binding protein